MSEETINTLNEKQSNKPDPTFLKGEQLRFKKPLGLAVEKRMAESKKINRGARLTRQEFDQLLDGYYEREKRSIQMNRKNAYTKRTNTYMMRNLAFIASLALFFGFGVGLYSLSQNGGETQLGLKLNETLSNIVRAVLPAKADVVKKTSAVKEVTKFTSLNKPIKTASLEVADASGNVFAGIPLKLSLNADSNVALLEIKIMNVPGDAVLTAGKRNNKGVWTLRPEDLNNVALVMSSNHTGPLHLSVELVEVKTGELLSPTREIKVAVLKAKPFKVGGL